MITEILLMNGYGLYVWSAFTFTLLSFTSLYVVIRIQYAREKKIHKKKGLFHPEGSSLSKNNRKIVCEINILLVDAYLQWYFGSKENALELLKKATETYEDLEYDEPSIYINVVHESYSTALYKMGKIKEAGIVASRGSIPYPGNVRLNYIQDLVNNNNHPISYYNVYKNFLDFDVML